MKRLFFFSLVFILILISSFKALDYSSLETISAIPEESILIWHINPDNQIVETIQLKNGYFICENNKITKGDFIMNVKPVFRQPEVLGNNHMISSKFYVIARFQIDSMTKVNEKVLVEGVITINSITKPISFLASLKTNGNIIELKSDQFKIKEDLFDLNSKAKYPELNNVSGNINLVMHIKAQK